MMKYFFVAVSSMSFLGSVQAIEPLESQGSCVPQNVQKAKHKIEKKKTNQMLRHIWKQMHALQLRVSLLEEQNHVLFHQICQQKICAKRMHIKRLKAQKTEELHPAHAYVERAWTRENKQL